jgi:UDP-N-acetylglucosamine--N-acetylmuramyl-(pentapeptide) pyrophosphoryl-undecaprenol N-acetylglucosamine transferase
VGYPVLFQEQNAYAGLTNRLLGKIAKAVFVAFSAAVPYFPEGKCLLYGNPIRTELRQLKPPGVARRYFFPSQDQAVAETAEGTNTKACGGLNSNDSPRRKEQVVLIMGGSLGAQAINRAVSGLVATTLEENPSRYIVWQTGVKYYEECIARTGSHPRLAAFPFINDMDMAYAAADLVVARAGAITCSELLVTGKPSILIPSPNVAEDHQRRNAVAMEEQGCAEALLQSSLEVQVLKALINELLEDPDRLMKMRERALKAATPDASNQIAQQVVNCAKRETATLMGTQTNRTHTV